MMPKSRARGRCWAGTEVLSMQNAEVKMQNCPTNRLQDIPVVILHSSFIILQSHDSSFQLRAASPQATIRSAYPPFDNRGTRDGSE
jgi:hypothetical protein